MHFTFWNLTRLYSNAREVSLACTVNECVKCETCSPVLHLLFLLGTYCTLVHMSCLGGFVPCLSSILTTFSFWLHGCDCHRNSPVSFDIIM